jgi:hypothetical protein
MSYTITYNESEQMFEMDGKLAELIGYHLETIGKQLKIKDMDDAISEGHMLSILYSHGVEVNLLEEDGSRMEW